LESSSTPTNRTAARNGCTQREKLGAVFSASRATLRRDAARIARGDPFLTRYLLESLLTCPGYGHAESLTTYA
jgi:hypothetical protein